MTFRRVCQLVIGFIVLFLLLFSVLFFSSDSSFFLACFFSFLVCFSWFRLSFSASRCSLSQPFFTLRRGLRVEPAPFYFYDSRPYIKLQEVIVIRKECKTPGEEMDNDSGYADEK